MAAPLTVKIGVDSANFGEVAQILKDMHDEIAQVIEKHTARIAKAAVGEVPK